MRWLGAAATLMGFIQSWKALQAAAQYGFHPWVTVVEQSKGRSYEVPLFEALIAGVVWLILGAYLIWCDPSPVKLNRVANRSNRINSTQV